MQSSTREFWEFVPPNRVVTQQWITSAIRTTIDGQVKLIHLPPDPTVAIILLQLRLHDPSFDMALYDQMIIAGQTLNIQEGQFAILDNVTIRDHVVVSEYKIMIRLVSTDDRHDDACEGGISGLV